MFGMFDSMMRSIIFLISFISGNNLFPKPLTAKEEKMYIEKLNTKPQTLKEISFKDFKTRIGLDTKIGLYKNILQDLHYTNIYIKEGQVKQYIFKYKGLFYKVPMSEQEFEQLTQKYNDLCKVSGLPPKKTRMQVSGYRRIKVA